MRNLFISNFGQKSGQGQDLIAISDTMVPSGYSGTTKIHRRDKLLVERYKSLINSHISDETLNNNTLAEMLGLSRSLYYEKIKNLIGSTPNEYLRNTRIKEAARLLHEEDFTISEVMFKVGYRDPKYFRDCFRKVYGMNPSDFIKTYPYESVQFTPIKQTITPS